MKVLIASDHAGLKLKEDLKTNLQNTLKGETIEWMDLGAYNESSVDYPDMAQNLCNTLLKNQGDFGVLVCGSGQGMAMKANRNKGIRAALCWDKPSTQLSREHNNANVLCLGGRLIPWGLAREMAQVFLSTAYAGGRHENRVKKLDQ